MLKMMFNIYDVISVPFKTNDFRVPAGVAQRRRFPAA
jgi:hypothetical protein